MVKRIFLCQKRIFAKLGKATPSLFEVLPIIKQVLVETYNNKLLLEGCRLCIECELFITELEFLTFFNHHITFAFLNCIEKHNQKDLLDILPTLYHDLINNSLTPYQNIN